MRTARLLVVLVGLCLVGVAGVAVTGAADTTAGTDTASFDSHVAVLASEHVNECAAEPPADRADPDGDAVGWVQGYWYNEPLDISGPTLTQEELDKLVVRTAARVEAIRCLDFEGLPPTEMRTRDEHRDELEAQFEAEVTTADGRFENARLSTALIAGQSVDAVELQLDSQTSFPAAFYDTEEEFIGFITENPDSIELDQTTLAHELTHALQDQHFELGQVFEEQTTDGLTSSLAVVEGDATLVEEQYSENCNAGAWVDSCITQSQTQQPEIPNWALTLEQLAAYNTPLAEQRYEAEGWAGVNALLEEMPGSIVEAIEPDRYGEFERASLTVEDASTDEWERVELEDSSYDTFGQHALTAILMAPFYETDGSTEIIDSDEFLVDPVAGTIDYGHPVTDGWRGDRLYGYVDDENDTAGVWQLAWENADEANTFADAFEDLAEYRGGALAGGYENVYTFPDSDEYDMALGIERDDDQLLVVTAPTIEGLTAVHGEFDAVQTGDDPDDGGTDDSTGDGGTGDDGTGDGGTGDDSTGDGGTGDDSTGDGGTGDDSTGDGGTGDDSEDDETDGGMDDGTDDETDENGTDDGTDGDGAGFGIVIVVGALVASFLVARWRGHNGETGETPPRTRRQDSN